MDRGNANLKLKQTDSIMTSQIERSKLPRNRYNYTTSCLFFMLKSKQLLISFHSIDGVVYLFQKNLQRV